MNESGDGRLSAPGDGAPGAAGIAAAVDTPDTTASRAVPAAPRPLNAAASGWRWLWLAGAVIIADQASKAWIVHHFALLERVHVLAVLDVILTYNNGAAFSFLSDASGWQRWVFVLLALVVSVLLIAWMRRLRAAVHGLLACGLAFIVGGALGNMIDRIAAGRVVDFIHVHWGGAYFPAFNVADSAITVGAAVLLIDAWRESRQARKDALMQVLLANPRGFCAGVDRAIDIVERALELFGAPIHVRHEIVHNRHVVERLQELGAVFVEELAEVPAGGTVIFSAHGVSTEVEDEARRRRLTVFNATCPLVTKVHMEVQRYAREARDVILIGHAGHPEVEGTMGRFDESYGGHIHLVQSVADVAQLEVRDVRRLAFVTQTTLSVDDTAEMVEALRARFPGLATPRREDICYATQNRQDAAKQLLGLCDVLVVVGSRSSSNSNRLRELADRAGIPGYLVDGPSELQEQWFAGKRAVGVTAGASAPEVLVRQVIEQLGRWGGETPREIVGREEHVVFTLPRELRRASEVAASEKAAAKKAAAQKAAAQRAAMVAAETAAANEAAARGPSSKEPV